MWKRALKTAVTFGFLVVCYLGYVRGFAVVARWVKPRSSVPLVNVEESQSSAKAARLAEIAFGPTHWAAGKELALRYYSTARGYWMYAHSYQFSQDRKEVTLAPFALIWESRDGKSLKTVVSNTATVELDSPFVSIQNSKPSRVIRARIEGDVLLRDTKGTRIEEDDLVVGPLTHLTFDDQNLQVVTDSPITIRDRNMWLTAVGMKIDLWPKVTESTATASFDGAKTAWLEKDVHIFVNDGGKTAILPGAAIAKNQGVTAEAVATGPQIPIDLRAAGPMRIDLPRPRAPRPPGEVSEPPAPTLVQFYRNVIVRRGNELPDQLNCDTLRLVLVSEDGPSTNPKAKTQAKAKENTTRKAEPNPPESGGGGTGGDGPLRDLALKRVDATGHAVWLQSPDKGIKTRCNQLVFEKMGSGLPDRTYLRGDNSTRLFVEREARVRLADGTLGATTSLAEIWAIDATIHDDGAGGEPLAIIARGPGRFRSRASRNGPIQQQATWTDQIEVRDRGEGAEARRVIAIAGSPRLEDPTRGVFNAKTQIIAWLKPKAGTTTATASPASSSGAPTTKAATPNLELGGGLGEGSGAFEIERLEAHDQVALTAPDQSLSAEDRLDVVFLPQPSGTITSTTTTAATANPTTATTASSPPTTTNAPATPTNGNPTLAANAPKDDPDVVIKARQVWAEIAPRGSGSNPNAWELNRARLRGTVSFHQDPEPGKERGIDVTGGAVDLTSQGSGQVKLLIAHLDPITPPKPDEPPRLARIVSEDFEIEGPVLSLDQAADFASVNGSGRLVQRKAGSAFNLASPDAKSTALVSPRDRRVLPTMYQAADGREQSKADARSKAAATGADVAARPPQQPPTTMTWTKQMTFEGRSTGPEGQPRPARIVFVGDVRGRTETASIDAQTLEAYLDRTISFQRAFKMPEATDGAQRGSDGGIDGKPQIVYVRARDQVSLINQRTDDQTGAVLDLQQVDGSLVAYDLPSGVFQITGRGEMRLYSRQGSGNPLSTTPQPVQAAAAAAASPNAPLTLTRLQFRKGMHGSIAGAESGNLQAAVRTSPKQADFYGDVQVLHARVRDASTDLDFDNPPADHTYLTAQTVQLISQPIAPAANAPASATAARDRLYFHGKGDANARTVDTAIQGDEITYDSQKELFYIYGRDTRDVVIAQSKSQGQPPSYGRSASVMYNRKTGQIQLFNPKGFQLFDAQSGARPQPPSLAAPRPKPQPRRFGSPMRNNPERNGFR